SERNFDVNQLLTQKNVSQPKLRTSPSVGCKECEENKARALQLLEENRQLAEVIKRMSEILREEIDKQVAAAVAQKQARIAELEKQLHKAATIDNESMKQLSESVSLLTQQLQQRCGPNTYSNNTEQITKLNSLMTDLQNELHKQKDTLASADSKIRCLER